MAKDQPPDTDKAMEFKEKGNKCFEKQDYRGAEAYYTTAINHDPKNPLLFTNRAMALLKMSLWDQVITDSLHAISLLPTNMKAYYYLAQAQIALHQSESALTHALKAHRLCVQEIQKTGKIGASLGVITELVLRCKKEDWERREKERSRRRGGFREEIMGLLEKERDRVLAEAQEGGERADLKREFEDKIEDLRELFASSDLAHDPRQRKSVPDYFVDDITFAVMVDPVVVSIPPFVSVM
ncbi:putative STIP1 like proteiny and U box-containing protein 1 [Glarea lozoyensis 74030]|uniref:RING-type E3 ubiquitin transferase n=1 Tax=Glarea lozoyensis (strain ATCC 74030 / MF5533) TaxID=1104152 RepID=H0EER5_GLAL7|nr:putative STIP1 like proteiny and U box-containing protein 1 [Glarea lozoyensis 74030]